MLVFHVIGFMQSPVAIYSQSYISSMNLLALTFTVASVWGLFRKDLGLVFFGFPGSWLTALVIQCWWYQTGPHCSVKLPICSQSLRNAKSDSPTCCRLPVVQEQQLCIQDNRWALVALQEAVSCVRLKEQPFPLFPWTSSANLCPLFL